MGEVLPFPERRKQEGDGRDIADTPEGRFVIDGLAKPAFRQALEAARESTDTTVGIDFETGDWKVIPLDSLDPAD